MSDNYLKAELDEDSGILTITLDRQGNDKNQLDSGMLSALESLLMAELHRPVAKGVILCSAREKVFSTGADIDGELDGLDSAGAARFCRLGREVFNLFTRLECVTVATLSGFALGGGLEIALCCDFRVANTNARVGLPEINLGLIPGWGGTQRLQRLIGRQKALRMILSGDPVNAATALEYGLVDQVVDSYDEMAPAAAKLISKFAAKSRSAIGIAKRAVHLGGDVSLAEGLNLESELFGLAWSTPAREEGISAYKEKRRPKWPE